MQSIDLAISPCPNDTFIFGNLLRRGLERADAGALPVATVFADVEELNRRAMLALAPGGQGQHAITKLSFFAMSRLREHYTMLNCGGALGRGCGPLLIAREDFGGNRGAALAALGSAGRVLIPGRYTTANLLTHLFLADASGIGTAADGCGLDWRALEFAPTRYEQILPALRDGTAEFGVIIHEERFTFAAAGLHAVQDLGAWWEATTGMPIPLGCIALRNDVIAAGTLRPADVEAAIRASLAEACARPDELRDLIKQHSQSLADGVIDAHIQLYVNEFSRDLGREGQAAVAELFQRADLAGIV